MAFPYVYDTATGITNNAGGTSGPVTIPTRVAGQVLLLIQTMYGGTATGKTLTIGTVDGVVWNLITTTAGTVASTMYFAVYYLNVGTTSASTTTATVTAPNSWAPNDYATMVIGGNNTASAPPGSTVTGGDPPLVTPAWGSADTLWIAACALYASLPTTDPAGYSDAVVGPSSLRVAVRGNTAASEDPGVFSGGSGLGSSVTLAVRPALIVPTRANLYRQQRRRRS